jgi:two-component system cell cycle sensor histidine kinase/response regulator CckA
MPGSKDLKSLYKYSVVITAIWTILFAGLLLLDISHERENTRKLALKEVRIHFNKDQALRRWAAMHGGVYVIPDDKTPPNPYLHVPDRDVMTTSGKSLTLMNPAYMLRQVMEFSSELYGVKDRITSLKLLNPANEPDEWERSSLLRFEQGEKEIFEFINKDGEPYLRFMAPLTAEKGCLKCHGFQGYKEGDVRGGITVSIPLAPYLTIERETIKTLVMTHGILWLLGVLSIGFVSYRGRQDIRERERTAAALRKSEARLSEAQGIAHFGNWEWNIDTNQIWWSDEIYRIFGLAPNEFGATYEAFIKSVHPDDRGFVKKSVEQALLEKGPYSIDHRIVRPDGVELFVHENGEVKFDESGNPVSMVGTVQDITERVRSENMLRNIANKVSVKTGHEYFQSLAEFIAKEMNMEYALVGRYNRDSNKVNTIAVYAHGRITDNMIYDLHETPCDNVVGKQPCVYREKIQELFPEDRLLAGMGAESYAGIPLFASDGNPIGIVAALGCSPLKEEISGKLISLLQIFSSRASAELERMKAEQELLESEARIKGIIDNVNIGVALIAPDLKVLLVNNQIKKWFGDFDVSAKPLCSQVFIPFSRAGTCFKCPTSKTLHDGKPHELTVDLLVGDATRSYRIISSPVKNKDGSIVSVIELLEDITEQKKLEEHLMHAQKMESVGTLAGGVAHDFNNIITAIMGFASVLNRRLKDEDPLKVYVKQIKTATENAAALTSSLLAFSRKQKIIPVVMDLNVAVKKMGTFLRRIIGEDIEFRTILAADHLNVRIDIGQMEQVLMNIVSNARDAMPEGGLLTILTELITIDTAFIQSHGYGTPGNYAVISVSDTGTGIDEKTKEKIFEPFFTTKEVNKGTGLGLAIAYGIIKQHNGYITADSAPGKGTRFSIYLPMTSQLPQERHRIDREAFPEIRGTETILVAEDETMIRELISSELTEFGYKVLTAVDGEDASNKFMENKGHIHMVISDMIMPRKSGKDFYREIKQIRPDIKMLFLSGYSEELMFRGEPLDENAIFVKKPVDIKNLLEKIREMLDRKS